MNIRAATVADVPAICGIFNHVIQTTTATFATTPVDPANRAAWLADRQGAGFPVLVADVDGVVGYATYGAFRAAGGYDLTVEHSVYVQAGKQGQGIGTALMAALIRHARGAGKHVMMAAIDADNAGSIRMHKALGFVQTAHLPQVGAKFGRWLDLVLLQLALNTEAAPPL